jgi:copper(I)-binding protein
MADFIMTGAALAQAYVVGAIKISQVWTREVPPASKVAGGYMTITNTGAEPDTLTGGSVVGAGKFEVHEMSMVDGVMKMRQLKPGLVIKPRQTIQLKPGSSHAMFVDLKTLPMVGQTMKGTLIFEKVGKIEIEYKVEPFGTRVPGDGGEPLKRNGSSGHEHH